VWLSATRVTDAEPVEIVSAIVNHDGTNAVFGVFATIDQWDGHAWNERGRIVMCLDHWFCTAELATEAQLAVPSIGLTPRRDLPMMTGRFSTKGLSRGWYRVSHRANEGMIASGVFEVAPDADPIAPLTPVDAPLISVRPLFLPSTGGNVQLTSMLQSARSITDLERAATGLSDSAAIERWTDGNWSFVKEIPLRLVRAPIESTGDVPALPEGEYRLVRHGPNGDHTGRFWVDDLND
jgi:hypothetical protein